MPKFVEVKTEDWLATVKDAKRYRWLRSDARLGLWMVMQWLPHLGKYERVNEEKIDDYIDSDIAKYGKPAI